MLNPVPLLTSLRFQPMGSSEVAGRPTIERTASRGRKTPVMGRRSNSTSSAPGADFYELEVDRQPVFCSPSPLSGISSRSQDHDARGRVRPADPG